MEQIDVRILDKDYRLIVGADEKARLLEAAALVDQKMRLVRDESRVTHLDRIAVGAALQLAEELISARQSPGGPAAVESTRRVRVMSDAIEAELKRQDTLF